MLIGMTSWLALIASLDSAARRSPYTIAIRIILFALLRHGA